MSNLDPIKYLDNFQENTDIGPSPNVWGDCPVLEIMENPQKGFIFFDDNLNLPVFATGVDQAGYITYQDTGVTIQQAADDVGGVLEIAGADADNDEGSITTGGGKGGMVKIVQNSGEKVWFEARVNFDSIVDRAAFIGLAEEGSALANVLVDDTGALVDKDFVGFRVLTADPAELDAIHQTAGGGGEIIAKEIADTLVADTYVKVGIKFDGVNTVEYFINGKSVVTVLATATDFPDGEELAVLFAIKAGEAVEKKARKDWWRVAMLRAS